MKEVHLQHLADNGEEYHVTFLPLNGMPFVSFKRGDVEIIDQSTWQLFHEKNAGLGQLIGPWFYHRKNDAIPMVADTSLFPHISRIKSQEPFSHGIGHFVRWNYSNSDTSIRAHISGMDAIGNVTYASLAGFDFKFDYEAHLTSAGLEIDLKVESPTNRCFAGLHTYYSLEKNSGRVSINCDEKYNDMGTLRVIPDKWRGKETTLDFDFKEAADYGFFPNTEEKCGVAMLTTGNRKVKISYKANDANEHGFQVYHPEGASFACIEPGTARNFREAKLKRNHIKIKIEVL